MNKTAKSTTSKDSCMGLNDPVSSEASTETMESFASAVIANEWSMSPAKTNCHKKKESP